jgi:hypothetical protein
LARVGIGKPSSGSGGSEFTGLYAAGLTAREATQSPTGNSPVHEIATVRQTLPDPSIARDKPGRDDQNG